MVDVQPSDRQAGTVAVCTDIKRIALTDIRFAGQREVKVDIGRSFILGLLRVSREIRRAFERFATRQGHHSRGDSCKLFIIFLLMGFFGVILYDLAIHHEDLVQQSNCVFLTFPLSRKLINLQSLHHFTIFIDIAKIEYWLSKGRLLWRFSICSYKTR